MGALISGGSEKKTLSMKQHLTFFSKTTQLSNPGKLYSTALSGFGCYDSDSFYPIGFIRISGICIRKDPKKIQTRFYVRGYY
jgi:hypothetical protein